MTKKQEMQQYQAQEDAYTMARYQEIMADKARASRAVKVANEQAKNLERQAATMKAVVTKAKPATTRKKK